MPRPDAFELSDPPVLGNPNFAALAQAFLGDLPGFAAFLEAYADWIEGGQYAELAADGKVQWTGDADTYINHPGADQIAAWVNGVRRFLLTAAAMQVDVPITGSAVQAGVADTTVGRLLLNGAHGLGATNNMPVVTDANLLNSTGFYTTTSNSTNVGVGGTGALTVYRSYNVVVQIQQTGSQTFRRRSVDAGSSWTPWLRLDSDRVSNANGDYVKLPDGTMICTKPSLVFTTQPGGLRMEAPSWSFPANFLEAPVVQFELPGGIQADYLGPNFNSGEAGKVSFIGTNSGATIAQGIRIHAVNGQTFQAGATITAKAAAIGRWF